jgi:hypothetical protein
MKRRSMRTTLMPLLFAVVLLLSGTLARAQQAASLNYGFVSPNTRDDLKLEDAIRAMNSSEEVNLLREAQSLGCVIKRKVTTLRALGSWSDGAEHSVLLRTNTDEPTIRYLMSRLGRDANQKAVIYFHLKPDGPARIYVLQPPQRLRSFKSISTVLERAGILFRTLVPTKSGTRVYVIDTDNNLAIKVKTAARLLKARMSSQSGNASFVGHDNDRQKGQTVFEQEIKDYEAKHPALPPPCKSH